MLFFLTLFNPPPVELKKKQEKQDKTAANPHKISARACPVLLRQKTGQNRTNRTKTRTTRSKNGKKWGFFFFDGLEPEKNWGVACGLKVCYNTEKEEKEEKKMTEELFKPKKLGRPSRCPDLETLNYLYMNKTTREISEMLGVPRETVRGWIKRARKQVRTAEATKTAEATAAEKGSKRAGV